MPRYLRESVDTTRSAPGFRVDRNAGVIYGVKVLGTHSKNTHGEMGVSGTVYTPECLVKARPLYEGMKVFADHPDRSDPNAERPTSAAIGVLRNVRAEADGLRADLHYIRTSQAAKDLVEDCERKLGLYGLSHNASAGETAIENGMYVVKEIAEVRSVDLVTRPATTRTLWESHTMPNTFRSLLESVRPGFVGKRAKWLNFLLEADDMTAPLDTESADMPAPMDTPPMPDSGGANDALNQGFRAAMIAVIDDVGMSPEDKMAKLKILIKTHSKLTSDNESMPDESIEEPLLEMSPGDEESGYSSGDDDDKDSDNLKESLQRENEVLKLLLESHGVTVKPVVFDALKGLATPEARKELLESIQTKSSKPRSAGHPVQRIELPQDANSFAKFIKD